MAITKIYEDLENLHAKKESLIEKLNQSRQEQDKLYQYKKSYDTYLGKEVERGKNTQPLFYFDLK